MKIKKYEAPTEQEAILKVKEDIGKDALILNIKKIQPKGVFRVFNKPSVEVTAAYEEKTEQEIPIDTFQSKHETEIQNKFIDNDIFHKPVEIKVSETEKNIEILEKKIDNLQGLLNTIATKISNQDTENYRNNVIRVMYENLIENEVMPDIATKLLNGLDEFVEEDKANINFAIKTVYNRIIDIIGKPKPIVINKKPTVVLMMGPTGVGKTTTIAKLSAYFMLKEQINVGLITADTYRIAAVEQLKVYSEIIGIETEVVYSENEIQDKLQKLSYKDIVFVDTAGRSHKNIEQTDELGTLLQQVNDCEKYLVLSVTTKCKDLISIINAYTKITDYSIIFTKADETITKGAILNICYLTGKTLSYITNGQSVPDDIEIIKPEEIAKALLGSIDE